MSPRRRLRTRYEPVIATPAREPAPMTAAEPAPVMPEPIADAAPALAAVAAPAPELEVLEALPDAAFAPPVPEAPALPASDVTPVPAPPPPPRAVPPPPRIAPTLVSAQRARGIELEPARPRRHRLRAGAFIAGFAILAFVTGLFVFNNLVMPRLIHGIGQVTVPDLTNLTLEQAEQALRPLGLQLTRAGERFDPFAPRGFVIAQDPAAGTSVRGRRHISVVVSLGEEFSSVPELSGESVRTARMLIDRAGLRAGTIVQAPSEDAGEGLVAGSDPAAEAVLQRNSPVHLLVSTGTVTESFVMPELLGREISGVRRQLEPLGFRIERVRGTTSVGTIVGQEPPAGSRISRATVIKLRTSGRMIR